jgi:hypothetical protein
MLRISAQPPDFRKAQIDALLLKLPGVSARKIHGLDAYFVSDRMFACISGRGIGLRLPVATATGLQFSRDNVFPFQPGGITSTREWIQIERADAADCSDDLELFVINGQLEARRVLHRQPAELQPELPRRRVRRLVLGMPSRMPLVCDCGEPCSPRRSGDGFRHAGARVPACAGTAMAKKLGGQPVTRLRSPRGDVDARSALSACGAPACARVSPPAP